VQFGLLIGLSWSVLLAGCDQVLSLDRPDGGVGGPQLRQTFKGEAVNSTTLTITRGADVQPDDMLVFVILGDRDTNFIADETVAFDTLRETFANGCTGDYHAFFLAGRAGNATEYGFTFDQNANWSALVTAYANVTSVLPVAAVDPTFDQPDVTLPPVPSDGSIAWIGTVASEPWNANFSNFTKRATNQNTAVFDAPIAGGTIPDTTYVEPTDPRTFCAAVTELAIK